MQDETVQSRWQQTTDEDGVLHISITLTPKDLEHMSPFAYQSLQMAGAFIQAAFAENHESPEAA